MIDCRGLGAKPQWNALRGVRGEVIRVHAPEVALQRPTRLVHPRYPLYIAPKPGSVFVIGATEIESDDMSPASVRSTLELLSAAYAVHSGFAEARILEIATQCRPTLPDNLPAIRQPHPRVLQINGLYRHGFMIAPAVLDAAMELLMHGRSALAQSLGLEISDSMTIERTDQRQAFCAARKRHAGGCARRAERRAAFCGGREPRIRAALRLCGARTATPRPHRSDPPRDRRVNKAT